MSTKKYYVEFLYPNGWRNAHWESNGQLWLFDSHADALAEIEAFCSIPEPDKPYSASEFRAV